MLPRISRDAVLAALREFDRDQRATEAWAGWEASRSHRWAIAHEGRRYPVKQIVALAAGTLASTFSGGEALNTRLARLGFVVVPLHPGAAPPEPEPSGIADLQQQLESLAHALAAAELRVVTEQARLRVALTALAETREYARHAAGCPVDPCRCGFIAADARAVEVIALATGEPAPAAVLTALRRAVDGQEPAEPVG